MRLLALAPVALAVVGVAKAGVAIYVGPALGLSPILLSIAASLWVTGPPTVAWLWLERRKRRAATKLDGSARA